jgi:hypothetical protein
MHFYILLKTIFAKISCFYFLKALERNNLSFFKLSNFTF